ncbi:MAG: M23 family metallopeptidase [Phenylobacterium sp.]
MRSSLFLALVLIGACAPAVATNAAPEGPKLAFPLACEIGRTCEVQHYVDRDPGPGVQDYRCARRTYEGHSGTDIRVLDMAAQRAGVDVLAAAPGRVARLRDGVADISIRAPGAPPVSGQECGNGVVIDHGDGWETQYCHLAKGSIRVKAGDAVVAGQPLARVGLSGNTEFPHLHLTVRHAAKVVDPFAPDMTPSAACKPQGSMWSAAAQREMAYKAGVVLNAGFAGGPVGQPEIEGGAIAAPTAESPYLVAYVRAIELEAGDRMELVLTAPGGAVLAQNALPPLDRDKAQYTLFVGKKRPVAGWPSGRYNAAYRVTRAGKVAVEQTFAIRL